MAAAPIRAVDTPLHQIERGRAALIELRYSNAPSTTP